MKPPKKRKRMRSDIFEREDNDSEHSFLGIEPLKLEEHNEELTTNDKHILGRKWRQ